MFREVAVKVKRLRKISLVIRVDQACRIAFQGRVEYQRGQRDDSE